MSSRELPRVRRSIEKPLSISKQDEHYVRVRVLHDASRFIIKLKLRANSRVRFRLFRSPRPFPVFLGSRPRPRRCSLKRRVAPDENSALRADGDDPLPIRGELYLRDRAAVPSADARAVPFVVPKNLHLFVAAADASPIAA